LNPLFIGRRLAGESGSRLSGRSLLRALLRGRMITEYTAPAVASGAAEDSITMRVRERFVSAAGDRLRCGRGGSIASCGSGLQASRNRPRRPLARVAAAVCVWGAGLVCLSWSPAAAPLPADVTTLSRAQAAQLVDKAEGPLVLGRLAGVGPEVALELARHGGGLALDGLTKIDAAAARALSLHGRLPATAPADLDLDALLAKIAALSGGDDGPDNEGIEQILAGLGGEGAAAAGEDPGAAGPPGDAWLSLGGLRQIDAEVAAALALHEGPLLLDGVRTLSVEAAAALAAHVGELSLAGLAALPADVRAALADHDGPVAIPDALVRK
jgi:hypothetical protein